MTFRGPYVAQHKGWSNGNPHYNMDGYTVTLRFDKPASEPGEHQEGMPWAPYLEYQIEDRHKRDDLGIREGAHGTLELPIDGLVEWACTRLEPTEIVQYFWNNDDVREQFAEALASSYTDGEWYSGNGGHAWNDTREKILRQMGCVLLKDKLDNLASALQSAEYYQRRYKRIVDSPMYGWGGDDALDRPSFLPPLVVANTEELMRAFPQQEGEADDRYAQRLHNRRQLIASDDPDARIGDKDWYASSEWWRKKLIELWGLQSVFKEGGLMAIEPTELARLRAIEREACQAARTGQTTGLRVLLDVELEAVEAAPGSDLGVSMTSHAVVTDTGVALVEQALRALGRCDGGPSYGDGACAVCHADSNEPCQRNRESDPDDEVPF